MLKPSSLRILSYLLSSSYRTKLFRVTIPSLGLEVRYSKLNKYTLDRRITQVTQQIESKVQHISITKFDQLIAKKKLQASLFDHSGALLGNIILCPQLRQSLDEGLTGSYQELGTAPIVPEQTPPAPLNHKPAWAGFVSTLKDEGRVMYYVPDVSALGSYAIKVIGVHPKANKVRLGIADAADETTSDVSSSHDPSRIVMDEEHAARVGAMFGDKVSGTMPSVVDREQILAIQRRGTVASSDFTLPLAYKGARMQYAPTQGAQTIQGVSFTSAEVLSLNQVWFFVASALLCGGRSLTTQYNGEKSEWVELDYKANLQSQFLTLAEKFGHVDDDGVIAYLNVDKIIASATFELFTYNSPITSTLWKALTDAGCNVFAITSLLTYLICEDLSLRPNVLVYSYALIQVALQIFTFGEGGNSENVYKLSLKKAKQNLAMIPDKLVIELPCFAVKKDNEASLSHLGFQRDKSPYLLSYECVPKTTSYSAYVASRSVIGDPVAEHAIVGLNSPNQESGLHFVHTKVNPLNRTAICLYDSSALSHQMWRDDNQGKQLRFFHLRRSATSLPVITSVLSFNYALKSAFDMEGFYIYPECLTAYISQYGMLRNTWPISDAKGGQVEGNILLPSTYREYTKSPLSSLTCQITSTDKVPTLLYPSEMSEGDLRKALEKRDLTSDIIASILEEVILGYSKTLRQLLIKDGLRVPSRDVVPKDLCKADLVAMLFSRERLQGSSLIQTIEPSQGSDVALRVKITNDYFYGEVIPPESASEILVVSSSSNRSWLETITDYFANLFSGSNEAQATNDSGIGTKVGHRNGVSSHISFNQTTKPVFSFNKSDQDENAFGFKKDVFSF